MQRDGLEGEGVCGQHIWPSAIGWGKDRPGAPGRRAHPLPSAPQFRPPAGFNHPAPWVRSLTATSPLLAHHSPPPHPPPLQSPPIRQAPQIERPKQMDSPEVGGSHLPLPQGWNSCLICLFPKDRSHSTLHQGSSSSPH